MSSYHNFTVIMLDNSSPRIAVTIDTPCLIRYWNVISLVP